MALKWFQQASGKALVIGLDGVPHSMLQRFMADGVMPNLASLGAEGAMTSMTVSLPEISSVSWTTFMTGRNPGEHGIFGFTDLHPGTYKMSFPSFRDVRVETIWDRLGAHKMRSVVINQPATYPARPMHGALISGFVAVHLDKSVFPSKYLRDLRAMDYEIDLDAQEVRDDPPALFRKLHDLLRIREQAMAHLWDAENWNLMEVIVTGTDRLHHFMMDAYADANHPHHEDFLDYYRAVDRFIGSTCERFTAAAGENADNVFILSDHGFCQTHKEGYMNSVLAGHGYLKFTKDGADSLEDISEHATAFCLDPARIYIHRRGRYPRGSVAESDVPRLKAELTQLFLGLEDDGVPVIQHVFDADDVYSGTEKANGPDLLLVPHNGYDLKGRIGAPAAVGERRLQGMHTWDDAFFLTRRTDLLDKPVDFNLVEIPGKILQSLNVES